MKIVFIPGLLCTNKIWGELNSIRDKYECVDADINSFNSISEMSRNIAKSFSREEIVVIGISMGGYVAIDLALQEPAVVKKLILINSTCYPVNPASIPDRERSIKLAEQGMLMSILKMNEGVSYYKPRNEWIMLERKMAEEVGAEVYVRQQKAIINRVDYSASIKKIQSDALIFSGKQDKILPSHDSIYMAEEIQRSSLVLLNNCGHLSTLEKGRVVKENILNFLES